VELRAAVGLGARVVPGAVVVELEDAVRALQAREALVRLLSAYTWFVGAHLGVHPGGGVVLVVIMTSPTDPVQRAAVLARVATHLDGVQLEAVEGPAATTSRTWRSREAPGTPAEEPRL
jgi:citrate lyase beta subunit